MKSILLPFFFLFNLLIINNSYSQINITSPFICVVRYYSLTIRCVNSSVVIIACTKTIALQIKYIHQYVI